MLRTLLPERFDNSFPGFTPALWIFAALLLLRGLIGGNCMLHGGYVAAHADGIPINSFGPAAARVIATDFAAWGIAQVMLALIGLVALVRYRAMVPLMLAVFLLEHASRKILVTLMPVATTGHAPGGYVNLAIFALEIAGLAMAVWPRKRA